MEDEQQELPTLRDPSQQQAKGTRPLINISPQEISSPSSSNASSLDSLNLFVQSDGVLTRSSSKTSLATLSSLGEGDSRLENDQKSLVSIGSHLLDEVKANSAIGQELDSPAMAESASVVAVIQQLENKVNGTATKDCTSASTDFSGLSVGVKPDMHPCTETPNLWTYNLGQSLRLLHTVEFIAVISLVCLDVAPLELLICLLNVQLLFCEAQLIINILDLEFPNPELGGSKARQITRVAAKTHAAQEVAVHKALLMYLIGTIELAVIGLVELRYLHLRCTAVFPLLHASVAVAELSMSYQPKVWMIPLFVNDSLTECKGDTGADGNLMASHVASSLNLKINEEEREGRFRPDGSEYWTIGTVMAKIMFPGDEPSEVHEVQFHVVLTGAYDLTVGKDFLQAHNIDRVNHLRSVQRHRHLWEIGQCLLVTVRAGTNNLFSFLPISIVNSQLKFDAMIDTGASINAISGKTVLTILASVSAPAATVRQSKTVIRYADREIFIARYVFELDICFGNKQTRQSFVVIPHLLQDILVGEHFCSEFEDFEDFARNKIEKQLKVRHGRGSVDAPLSTLGPGRRMYESMKEKSKSFWPTSRHRRVVSAEPSYDELRLESKQALHHYLSLYTQCKEKLWGTSEAERIRIQTEWAPRLEAAKREADRKHQQFQNAGQAPVLPPGPRDLQTGVDDDDTVVPGPSGAGIGPSSPATSLVAAASGSAVADSSGQDALAIVADDQAHMSGADKGSVADTAIDDNRTQDQPGVPVTSVSAPTVDEDQQARTVPENATPTANSEDKLDSAFGNTATPVSNKSKERAVDLPATADTSLNPSLSIGSQAGQDPSQSATASGPSHYLRLATSGNGRSSAEPSSQGPSSINEAPQVTPRSSRSPTPSVNGGSESEGQKLSHNTSLDAPKPAELV